MRRVSLFLNHRHRMSVNRQLHAPIPLNPF